MRKILNECLLYLKCIYALALQKPACATIQNLKWNGQLGGYAMYLNVLPSSMFAGNVIKDDWYIFYIVVYFKSISYNGHHRSVGLKLT